MDEEAITVRCINMVFFLLLALYLPLHIFPEEGKDSALFSSVLSAVHADAAPYSVLLQQWTEWEHKGI